MMTRLMVGEDAEAGVCGRGAAPTDTAPPTEGGASAAGRPGTAAAATPGRTAVSLVRMTRVAFRSSGTPAAGRASSTNAS